MGKEQELRPCPFCGARLTLSPHPINRHWRHPRAEGDAPRCPGERLPVIPEDDEEYIAAWNRRSSDEQAEVVESRDVLFFASYCGGDNPACTPARPCADCIAMGNVYSIPAGTQVLFQREFGASPPAVAKGGVTEEMVRAAEAAVYPRHERGFLVKPLIDPIDMRAALTAALAVRDEGIREGERFPVTLGKVNQAIDGYVQALVDRQHGGVAQDRAFNAICEALGRSPTAEMDARRLPTPPSRGEAV